jgi:PTH1 family peptidyl-tRNA hydrolase
VGSDFHAGQQSDYVVGEWSMEEDSQMDERIKTSKEFIKGFTTIGLSRTMSNWNNK